MKIFTKIILISLFFGQVVSGMNEQKENTKPKKSISDKLLKDLPTCNKDPLVYEGEEDQAYTGKDSVIYIEKGMSPYSIDQILLHMLYDKFFSKDFSTERLWSVYTISKKQPYFRVGSFTLLQLAVVFGKKELVEKLLEKGANTGTINGTGGYINGTLCQFPASAMEMAKFFAKKEKTKSTLYKEILKKLISYDRECILKKKIDKNTNKSSCSKCTDEPGCPKNSKENSRENFLKKDFEDFFV